MKLVVSNKLKASVSACGFVTSMLLDSFNLAPSYWLVFMAALVPFDDDGLDASPKSVVILVWVFDLDSDFCCDSDASVLFFIDCTVSRIRLNIPCGILNAFDGGVAAFLETFVDLIVDVASGAGFLRVAFTYDGTMEWLGAGRLDLGS